MRLNSFKYAITFLTGQRPWVYFAAYSVCIIVFSVLFWINDQHFYHSTLKYEQNYKKYKIDIVLAIEDELREQQETINAIPKCRQVRKFLPERLSAIYWKYESINELDNTSTLSNILLGRVGYLIWYEEHGQIREGHSTMEIWLHPSTKEANLRIPVDSVGLHDCYRQNAHDKFPGIDLEDSDSLDSYRRSNPNLFAELQPRFAALTSIRSQNTYDEIQKPYANIRLVGELRDRLYGYFTLVANGNPAIIDTWSESMARMLYLSAVTISTLGYGDIVPTHKYTRLLVAIESFIGIVIAGLFISSLTRRK